MADRKDLNLRGALQYLAAELKKRQETFAKDCAELKKKEGAGLSKGLPGELARDAGPPPSAPPVIKEEIEGGDLAMNEDCGPGYDMDKDEKSPAQCPDCGGKTERDDLGHACVCDKCCKTKKAEKSPDKVPAKERTKGSVLPADKKPKEVSAGQKGQGDVKKLKMAKTGEIPSKPPRNDEKTIQFKVQPDKQSFDKMKAAAKPAMAKAATPMAPKAPGAGAAPKTPGLGAGSPQMPKSPAMAGAAIPPPSPGMKPMKMPGMTAAAAPKAAPAGAPVKKDELGKSFSDKDLATVKQHSPQLRPRDAMKQAIKLPGARASAGGLMDKMLAAPAAAPKQEFLPVTAPVIGGAVVAGGTKPAQGVKTMAERIAAKVPQKQPPGPPGIRLPGFDLFNKPSAAVPAPAPASSKPGPPAAPAKKPAK